MRKILSLVLILTIVSCAKETKYKKTTNKPTQESIITNFENQLKKDIQEDDVNGAISAAIIKNDSIIWIKSFGVIDYSKDTPTNPNTIFRIGSITKSFTGFLMMQLQEKGILDINDPVEKYLPEIQNLIDYDKHNKITLAQLASHTSGLDRESQDRDANFGAIEQWQEKVLNAISKTSFRNKPEERFRYSNIGYAILGLAISKAANTPYIELVKKHILTPLQMENTYFIVPEDKQGQLAKGMGGGPLAELDFRLPEIEHNGRGYRVPNGAIYSTAEDMAKFLQANLNYTSIIKKESLEVSHATHTPTKRMRDNYGLGFSLYEKDNFKTVGHGGSTPGYSAHAELDKTSGYGVILMRNYNWGNTNFDLRANALLKKLSQL